LTPKALKGIRSSRALFYSFPPAGSAKNRIHLTAKMANRLPYFYPL
jgi:hypothetical protein